MNLKPSLLGLAAACCLSISANAQYTAMNQNTSQSVDIGAEMCAYQPSGETAATSYYRVFKISDYVTANYFNVDSVQFGVYAATSNSTGAVPVNVNIYSLTGTTLNLANLTLLSSISGGIPDVNGGEIFTGYIPASIVGTGTIVVEIATADFGGTSQSFIMGCNSSGQTKPSYWLAPSCAFTDIIDINSPTVGAPYAMDLLISVYGRGVTNPPPSMPGAFVNPVNPVCDNHAVTYTVPAVAGMTYNWTYSGTGVSADVANTTLSGNSIILDFAPGATSGTLGVSNINATGTSAQRTLAITVNASLDALFVTRATDTTLTVASTATSYAWYRETSAIAGATNATYQMTQGGDYFVIASNGTCSASSDTLYVPDAPDAFTNPQDSICLSNTQTLDVTYSVPAVPLAWNYNWDYSGAGVMLTSTSPATANYETVTFAPINATSGTLSVTYVGFDINSNPSNSFPRKIAITVNSQPIPSISKGGNVLTAGTGFASYAWYQNNIAITGATTNVYTITGNGNYYVKVTNAAGCTGTSDTAHVTDYNPTAINNVVNGNVAFSIYPNPARNGFTVALESKMGNSDATISITDITGRTLQTQSLKLAAGKQLVSMATDNLKDGIYFVNVNVEGNKGTQKLVLVK